MSPPSPRLSLRRSALAALSVASILVPGGTELSGQEVPSPEAFFGFPIGADRQLADWDRLTAYYEALARASDRVMVDTLGVTTRGRPFVMLTVTSPSNHARLGELREIQRRLADPRLVEGPPELRSLLDRGRVVALLTHGIHSTEVGSAQMAARLLWRLASSRDPDILEILDQVVVLDIPSLNPDGTDWIAEWYVRHRGTRYEGAPLPWLYHFYVGHDNNRDWYAFTQQETLLTVEGAHNAWRPQIVHDIHQMGGSGARIFFPPYIDPWEPNVDPALVSGASHLGSRMAADLTARGREGVVIQAIYDAWTPARAYSHYHGGVRILSETASARLATPVTVSPLELGPGRGYDPSRRSWNHPRPWSGGEWGLPDIVDHMEEGALALLRDAARNRRQWLETFHGIGRRAVAGWESWPEAWVIPASAENLANPVGLDFLLRILRTGDVEVRRATTPFSAGGRRFDAGSWVVPMHQPYGAFAQTLLERQDYPDLRDHPGDPPVRPYDVTAHTLPLLMGVEAVPVDDPLRVALSETIPTPTWNFRLPEPLQGPAAPRVGLYKPPDESMEAGWTRWLFDRHGLVYDTLDNADVRAGDLATRYDVLLLQSQSPESILQGFSEEEVPARWAGGIGDAGVRALRTFVRQGGRLVAVEAAADLAVDIFGLRVGNAVERLPPEDFYVPGSILRVELEEELRGDDGPPDVPAWFWPGSRAFDLRDPTLGVWARYAGEPLLESGWILGSRYLAGRPAVVAARVGAGSVVLFGFQPNYRGQSVVTWPLLFRTLSVPRRDGGVPGQGDAGHR